MREEDTHKRQKNKLYIVLVLIVIALIALIPLANSWMDSNKIKQIIVFGNEFIPSEEIKSKIEDKINSLKSEPDTLVSLVTEHPFIEETIIMHNTSEEIKVEVKEKTPIAMVALVDGSLMFIDKKQNLLPYHIYSQFKGLPILRNIVSHNSVLSEQFQEINIILEAVKKPELQHLEPMISEIVYIEETSSYQLITSDTGTPVILGKITDLEEKLYKFSCFYKELYGWQSAVRYKYIDLRWNNQVVTA